MGWLRRWWRCSILRRRSSSRPAGMCRYTFAGRRARRRRRPRRAGTSRRRRLHVLFILGIEFPIEIALRLLLFRLGRHMKGICTGGPAHAHTRTPLPLEFLLVGLALGLLLLPHPLLLYEVTMSELVMQHRPNMTNEEYANKYNTSCATRTLSSSALLALRSCFRSRSSRFSSRLFPSRRASSRSLSCSPHFSGSLPPWSSLARATCLATST